MSEWNWNPVQAQNGPRYEVLILVPAESLFPAYALRSFGTKDSSRNWRYGIGFEGFIEEGGQRVVAFRVGTVTAEDEAKALELLEDEE